MRFSLGPLCNLNGVTTGGRTEGTEMDWKSFAKGVVATLIVLALAFCTVQYMKAFNKGTTIEFCETAITRIEGAPLSHLGEMEIEACTKVHIEIPEGG